MNQTAEQFLQFAICQRKKALALDERYHRLQRNYQVKWKKFCKRYSNRICCEALDLLDLSAAIYATEADYFLLLGLQAGRDLGAADVLGGAQSP